MPRLTPYARPWLASLLLLLGSACQGELEGTLDVLPERYPNRLEPSDRVVSAVLFSPPDASLPPRDARALARPSAPALDALDEPAPAEGGAEVRGSVELRDVDGDGRPDAVATFDVDALRAAGLLSATRHGVEVRVEGSDVTWVGRDRLFDIDAPLVVLPEPSGPFDVGTAALLLFDSTRPGNGEAGRGLLVRLWYPALHSDRQPASYFLDPRQAERNLSASPLPLPPDLFESTHAFAREHVPAADPEPRPALILSTGWGAAVETYGALAAEFASHGYLVLGINHPSGAGAVVYPDGSEPEPEASLALPDDESHRNWALDIEHVAAWLQATPSAAQALACGDERARPNVRAALAQLDPRRIAALGHSFGGAAAVRADAESSAIAASADLDGALLGDLAGDAARARTLVFTSPDHSEFDTSIETFCRTPNADCQALSVAGTSYSNFGDTSWLYSRVLEVYPDLTRRGYQLGDLAPVRAHVIVSTYLRAFFEARLVGLPARLLEGPSPEYPEVVFH